MYKLCVTEVINFSFQHIYSTCLGNTNFYFLLRALNKMNDSDFKIRQSHILENMRQSKSIHMSNLFSKFYFSLPQIEIGR
jgi:hypothetical protein